MLIQANFPFKVVYTNAAFSDLTGLSSVMVMGKNFDKFLPADTIADILSSENLKNQQHINLDPSGGTLGDGCHGNCYVECNIKIILINPPLYLLVELSKRSEQQEVKESFEVDLLSVTEASITGDESADLTEPFSLVG